MWLYILGVEEENCGRKRFLEIRECEYSFCVNGQKLWYSNCALKRMSGPLEFSTNKYKLKQAPTLHHFCTSCFSGRKQEDILDWFWREITKTAFVYLYFYYLEGLQFILTWESEGKMLDLYFMYFLKIY